MLPKVMSRLRTALDQRNLSQEWLAHQLSVDESTLSRWFTNNRPMPLRAFLRACQALDVSPASMLGAANLAPDENELLSLYRDMLDDEQDIWLTLMRAFKINSRQPRPAPPEPESPPAADEA